MGHHEKQQSHANGFQAGWHAALTRISEGDSVDTLRGLVPNYPPARAGSYWLVETIAQPTRYLVARGEWCDNPNHAFLFDDEEWAKRVHAGLVQPEQARVTEHVWTE